MNEAQQISYSFSISGFPSDAFQLVDFTGEEGISRPYSFSFTLMSQDANVDPMQAKGKGASFSIVSAEGKSAFQGMIFSFRRIRALADATFYRCVMGPKLAVMDLSQHTQVFLNQTIPQILEATLKQCGVTEYEFRLKSEYPQEEYVCQFNETYFNFISRWMEKLGMYYFFENKDSGEKLIVTDTKIVHTPLWDKKCQYLQQSNLDALERNFKIFDMELECSLIPENYILKDYNYMHPSTNLEVKAAVSEHGIGSVYHYGDHYLTTQQGEALAKVRAEERLCNEAVAMGEGTVPLFRSGYLIGVEGHPSPEINATFLLTRITHQGRQNLPVAAGLTNRLYPGEAQDAYRNTFTALPSDKQFRPPRQARMRRFHGLISAFIDESGSGEYAQLDEYGRYKVTLPFDLASRPPGKASSFLRLAEPYAGAYYGMHFPLHKGTEVFLAFIDGNPDRPVISSAVHNAENKNMVNNQEEPFSAITTAAGNQVILGDQQNQEFIYLACPNSNSSVAMGQTENNTKGLRLLTEGDYFRYTQGSSTEATIGSANEINVGQKGEFVCGAACEGVAGMKAEFSVGPEVSWNYGGRSEIGSEAVEIHDERTVNAFNTLTLSGGTSASFVSALNNLKTTWKIMVGTNVGMAASTALAGELMSGHVAKPYELAVSLPEACVPLIWGMKLSKDIQNAGNDLEKAPVAGKMEFSKTGCAITANSTAEFPGAKIDLSVVDTQNDPVNTITMSNSSNIVRSIELTSIMHQNKETLARIVASNSNNVVYFKTPHCSFSMTDGDGQTSTTITCGVGEAAGTVTVSDEEIELKKGGSTVTCTSQGIVVKTQTSSLSINDGKILVKTPVLKYGSTIEATEEGMVRLGGL